jgi:outer membrane murein-binding lipoprotein Lpp
MGIFESIISYVLALFGVAGWVLYLKADEKRKQLEMEVLTLNHKIDRLESAYKESLNVVIRDLTHAIRKDNLGLEMQNKIDDIFNRALSDPKLAAKDDELSGDI